MTETNDFEDYWSDQRERPPAPALKAEPLTRHDLRGMRPDFPDVVYQVIHNVSDGLDRIELWALRVDEDGMSPHFGPRPVSCWRAYFQRRLWHGGRPRERDDRELRRRYVIPKRHCHIRLEDALNELRTKAAECAQREFYFAKQAEERRAEAEASVAFYEERLRVARNFEISQKDLDLTPEERGQLKLF